VSGVATWFGNGTTIDLLADSSDCDSVSVCFGFMHEMTLIIDYDIR
jgi:hypothetical protein